MKTKLKVCFYTGWTYRYNTLEHIILTNKTISERFNLGMALGQNLIAIDITLSNIKSISIKHVQ